MQTTLSHDGVRLPSPTLDGLGTFVVVFEDGPGTFVVIFKAAAVSGARPSLV